VRLDRIGETQHGARTFTGSAAAPRAGREGVARTSHGPRYELLAGAGHDGDDASVGGTSAVEVDGCAYPRAADEVAKLEWPVSVRVHPGKCWDILQRFATLLRQAHHI
jgi:hypothetical protein